MGSYKQCKPPRGVKVSPQSKINIQRLASAVRTKLFAAPANSWLDLAYHLEFTLPKLGLEWEVVEKHVMPDIEAATNPDNLKMVIREDIYNALHNSLDPLHNRARFTIAHEFGHLLMHEGVALARHSNYTHKFFEDSEWQADAFAAELLMPSEGCLGMTPEDIRSIYGVSNTAAQAKYNALNK